MAEASPPVDVERGFAAIDAANRDDPVTVEVRGRVGPKEQLHAELAVEWVRRLVPDPSPALLLAARAHHVRRWEVPRSTEPAGRAGYLRWRRGLERHHAAVAAEALRSAGVDEATIARVGDILTKRGLKHDPEVQAFEDALCLVFVETQFADLARKLEPDRMVEVVAKTLVKMTAAGRSAAASIPLDDASRAVLERAVASLA